MIFDKEDGTKVVVFGEGTVLISNLEYPGSDNVGVCFTPTDKREIGQSCDDVIGMLSENIGADVVMVFSKVESIDVLVRELEIAKSVLVANLSS